MALQTEITFPTGVVAEQAYSVVMNASINKAENYITADVWVYYDAAARFANRAPINRFTYMIYDNVAPQQDATWHLHVYRLGDIAIKLGDDVLVSTTITDEIMQSPTFLQDVADELQHQSLSVIVQHGKLVVKAIGALEGAAGSTLSVHGNAMQILDWLAGSDAIVSDLEAFTPDALSVEGVNLQQQIYNHMKAKDPRYADAIDV
jgi:hypothetical protein